MSRIGGCESLYHNPQKNAVIQQYFYNWLIKDQKHSTLTIGYLRNYLPYCDTDAGGNVTGIIKDFMPLIIGQLGLDIPIKYVEYQDSHWLIEDLKSNRIDLAFPMFDDSDITEDLGLLSTDKVISYSLYIAYKDSYTEDKTNRIAINKNNIMQENYTKKNFPDAQYIYCDNIRECLDAIAQDKAGSTILNGLRSHELINEYKVAELNSLMLPETEDFVFYLNGEEWELCEVLNYALSMIDSDIIYNMAYNYTGPYAKYSILDFARMNIYVVLIIIVVLTILIVALILTFVLYHRFSLKVNDQQKKLLLDLRMMNAATKSIYGFIGILNLTKNESRILCTKLMDVQDASKLTSVDSLVYECASHISSEEQSIKYQNTFRLSSLFRAFNENNKEISLQHLFSASDGEEHWIESKVIFVSGRDSCIYAVYLARIIDSDVKTLKDLEEAKVKADSANKAKSMFLFNMSHDIRTPMNAIIGFTALAKKYKDDSTAVGNYLDKISSSCENLLSLINNILEFARIENGKIVVREEINDIEKCFESNILLFKQEVEKKNIHLVTEICLYNKNLYFDKSKVDEIFLNIISNAVKYTPDGGTIAVSICEKKLTETECQVEFIVLDNGIGMSEEFQKHIFESFERERNTTTSGVQGTGLGMGIVKKIVDELNGSIEIESKIEKGTQVTIRTINRIADSSVVEDKADLSLETKNLDIFKGKSILLAEDNDLNAEIAEEILKDLGFRVTRVSDGVECIEIVTSCHKDSFDLILMDVQMPVVNGYEASKKIRNLSDKDKASIPIVAMTANAFDEDKQDAFAAGMNGHISKPIQVERLIITLKDILRFREEIKN